MSKMQAEAERKGLKSDLRLAEARLIIAQHDLQLAEMQVHALKDRISQYDDRL